MKEFDHAFKALERPFTWLHLDALDANIQYVQKQCGEQQIRIATKSVRSIEVLRYIQRRLSNCSGFMSFTASETLYLLEQGFDNILIGYPVYEAKVIEQIGQFIREGRKVLFMVDDIVQAILLQKIAANQSITFEICIDINVSTDYKLLYFGTKRSPIDSLEKLKRLTEQLTTLLNIKLTACMAYDAQIAGVTDATNTFFGMKDRLVRLLKKHSLGGITTLRQQAVDYLRERFEIEIVNAGGTGSMHLLREADDISEITVGSAFYAPSLFSNYQALQLQPAAGFALHVTRKFAHNVIVCHGGGYIASGVPGNDRLPQFLEPDVYAYSSLEGAGEVQTPIIVKEREHEIGDTIYFRHAKAGELCERFNELHTVRDGAYAGAFNTYRGDGKCFL